MRESLDAHGWVCAETVPGMIHTLDDLVPSPDTPSDIEVVEAGVASQPEGRPDLATLHLSDLGEKTFYGG